MKFKNKYLFITLVLLGWGILVTPAFGWNKKPENRPQNNITILNHQINNSNTNKNINNNSQQQNAIQNSSNNISITNDNNSNISNNNSINLTNNPIPQTIPLQVVTVAPIVQTTQLPQTGSPFLSLATLLGFVPLGLYLRKLA